MVSADRRRLGTWSRALPNRGCRNGRTGYTYDEILLHYYKGADIRRFY